MAEAEAETDKPRGLRDRRVRIALMLATLLVLGAFVYVRSRPSPLGRCATFSSAPSLAERDVSAEMKSVAGEVVATDVAPLDARRALVTERTGRVLLLDVDGHQQTVLDLTDETSLDGEQGLLSLAFSPNRDRLLLSRTDLSGDLVVESWPWVVGATTMEPGTEREIIRIPQMDEFHNGGGVRFGPDGMLYIAAGEGGSSHLAGEASQDIGTVYGSLLRIDVSSATGDAAYKIPADNPFVDDADARPEVWAYGLRNPWRFSFDETTGDLWIGDVGENCNEEIDLVLGGDAAGLNFGWPLVEGLDERTGEAEPDQFDMPLAVYPHQEPFGCSITGGVVYRGDDIPDLVGEYVFGDLCGLSLWTADPTDGELHDLGVPIGYVTSIVPGPDGELWMTSVTEGVMKLVPSSS